MKIVVIGGTGLIGSQVVKNLEHEHDVVAASPQTGVDTVTGAGVAEALEGAQVVVDLSNSPSFAEEDVTRFFRTSTKNLLDAEAAAGVQHHVVLSIVGTDVIDSGYMRAKVVQEDLVRSSGAAWSIVRSTQFLEFLGRIADSATVEIAGPEVFGFDEIVRTDLSDHAPRPRARAAARDRQFVA
ncbi:SDR family oxidoreductase [Antribacter gilvus]|uniref:SDR family oxidoreductase n=1 Tax=Antribacter gilvus TaxID=2304675 RepID=UPI000F7B1EE9|nr:NAD(P)H-binding protein [Antribacter gilvus]